MRLWVLLVGLVLSLDACGGGGGGSTPAVPVHPGGGPSGSGTAKVVLTITIPKSHARKPSTVSPATQSVGVAVNGGSPQVFNATLTSAGCGPGSTGPVTCAFTVLAPAGLDTFEVITWSATGGAGGGGSPLNVGDSTALIAANGTSAVPVTLSTWAVASLADTATPGTLRTIVGGAASGDTIGFAVRGKITLTSSISIGTSVTLMGPPNGAVVDIDGGGTQQLFLIAGSTLAVTMQNLEFSNAHPASSGGAIYIPSGNTVVLQNDDFESNVAAGQGGAIYAGSGSNLVIGASIFNLNSANNSSNAQGGAIYTNGTLSVSVTTFQTNDATSTASAGGTAASPNAGGGAIFADSASNTTLGGDTFTSNFVSESSGGNSEGGAVFSSGVLNDTTGWFTTNNATSTTASGGTASAPNAGGGAVFVPTGGNATFSAVAFTGNFVSDPSAGGRSYGGALFSSGKLTIHGGSFQSNTATDPLGFGGAIEDLGSITVDNASSPIAAPLFKSNQARSGGAIEADSGSPSGSFSNVTFDSNAATDPANGTGGAVNINVGGPFNFTNVTFFNNTATTFAGAMESNAGSGMTMTNSSFTGNSVSPGTVNGAGALDLDNSAQSLTNVQFANNTSTANGGALTDFGGIPGNIIKNCVFSGNTSVLAGGAIDDSSGDVITGSTFSGNSSTGSIGTNGGGAGGAIFTNAATSISTTTLNNNTAVSAGGAMYIQAAAPSIVQSTISTNSVTGAGYGGGALYIDNSGTSGATIANDTFYNNAATGADGGAIYNAAAPLNKPPVNLDFSTFANNRASGNGGAIYNNAVTSPVIHSGRRQPQSGVRRPFFSPSWGMSLTNSLFQGNTAPTGADIQKSAALDGFTGNYDFFADSSTNVTPAFTSGGTNNLYGVAANLGPLQINAPGSTMTMAPGAGSPVNNVIPPSCSQSVDQRGVPRPEPTNTQCTVGAYEYP